MRANTRTFGIELEVYLPSTVEVTVGRYHSGLQINGLPAGWNAQADSSVTGFAPIGFYGVEVVSPVLSGEDGLVQVVDVVNALNLAGAKVNEHCGFHIHVGAKDFSSDDILNLVKEFQCYQKVFLALNGQNASIRESNRYCQLVNNTEEVYYSRYYAINIQNWFANTTSKKTVELRIMASTLDIETIFTTILAFVGLVCKAKESPRKHQVKQMSPVDFVENILSKPQYQMTDLEDDFQLFFEKIQPAGIF